MCSVGSFWKDYSKFIRDCCDCIHLKDQLSNGCDASTYCARGHTISRVDTPLFPCYEKQKVIK